MAREEKIIIKRATPRDAGGVEAFFKECLPTFPLVAMTVYPPEKKKEFIDGVKKGKMIFFLAKHRGKVVGEVGIHDLRQRSRLAVRAGCGICVHPAYQGRGIGKKLLKRAIAEARRLRLKRLEAEIVCNNAVSLRLFKKAGFRIEGRKRKTFLADSKKLLDTYIVGLVL